MSQPRILVTGGSGFVGKALCQRLLGQGWDLRVPTRRRKITSPIANCEYVVTGDLTQFANWNRLVRDVDAIVHLVARTHMTDEFGASALQAYRSTNVDITRRLSNAAKNAGVRHVVYLSSIKAVANSSTIPLTETTPCVPSDSYGITKHEAEQTIRRQLIGSGTTSTILRPPLVYGPGVSGNFLRLLDLVQRGIPLPRIKNQRSVVHVDNLVDAICLSLKHEAARDQTFHVADSSPISTAELVVSMAKGLRRQPRLVPVPKTLLKQLGRAVGKREEVRRLADSLVVSCEMIKTRLNWVPGLSTTDGVEQTSRAFAEHPWHAFSSSTHAKAPRVWKAA